MTDTPKNVTAILADFVLNSRFENIPEDVKLESARTLLNWMGVAIGGCKHESVEIAVLDTDPERAFNIVNAIT